MEVERVEIKRYDLHGSYEPYIAEDKEGGYVKYDDYQTVESQLAKANALIIEQIEQLAEYKEASRKTEKQIFNLYGQIFPNYAWTDQETAIDLLGAEILILRTEKERYKEALRLIENAFDEFHMSNCGSLDCNECSIDDCYVRKLGLVITKVKGG